jgi:hypothetical protein
MSTTSRLVIAALNTCRFGIFCVVPLLTVASDVGAAETDRTIVEFLGVNGDNRASYDEFTHSIAVQVMREMDADKNGFLTPDSATLLLFAWASNHIIPHSSCP